MRLWDILRTRVRSLLFRGRRDADLGEELQFHLERETERLEATGMRPEAARRQALQTFGAVELTKEACRDARGTQLIDHIVRDIRFTWRSFRRAPLVALTIVSTVGLGLGMVAVVFTILNAYVFRVDEVRNPSELFAVERLGSSDGERGIFTRSQYDAFVRETMVFSEAFASTSDARAWIDGRRREGRLVTGNFFTVLGVNAARGRLLVPFDDEPGRPAVIVLSHRAWTQYFSSDPDLIGRTVRVNGASFQVVGVTAEGFRGLEPVAAPDFWAPLSLFDEFQSGHQEPSEAVGLRIIGRLKSGLSGAQALAQLAAWDSQAVTSSAEPPRARLVLEPRPGTTPLSVEALLLFMPLFFAFGLILLIGCSNVANLLLARGVARQREIGIRLAIGASRRRVVQQLLTESLLLAVVSAAVAFGVSRLVLAGFVHAVTSTFPPDIGQIRLVVPPADWRVALFLTAGSMLSTMFFALAPALQATRVELTRAIRGEVVRDGRPGRVRDGLIALQVTGSVVLLITAAVFLRSSWAAAAVDPGIRTAGVLSVQILDERRRTSLVNAVESEPLVEVTTVSWPGRLGGLGAVPAEVRGGIGKSAVPYRFVSREYFDVFGIDLVRGRGFNATERNPSAAVAVVSERVARELWPGIDAIGQVLRVEPTESARRDVEGLSRAEQPHNPLFAARTVVVIGVARDVPGFRIGGVRLGEAGVYMPISAEEAGTWLTMRVSGDSDRARHVMIDRLAAIDPNASEISTLQTITRAEAYLLGIPFWLALGLGALALLLTVSGLFSVLSYLVEQRAREIGVRMTLGATRRTIGTLVLSQLARPVGLGVLLGSGLTAALGAALLATPAAEQIGSTVRLFDPIAYSASLTCVIAACMCAALVPTLRATRIDPVGALRQD